MTLAIFDLDETLISIDSDHAWGEFIVHKGLVDPIQYRHSNDAYYQQYKQGKLDVDAYLLFACEILTQYPMKQLMEVRREFVEERIKPAILPKAVDLIESHRQQGDCLLVITATLQFVTEPIVELFSIPNLIAPIPELKNNQYTGKITGIPSYQEGKLIRLREWLKDRPYELAESCFYSDSINDIPLLESVGTPIVVDPDPKLLEEARERGWKVTSLRT